jgi:hypothetical protein
VRVTIIGHDDAAASWYVTVVIAQLSVATPWLVALLNSRYDEAVDVAEKTGPDMFAVEHPFIVRVTGVVDITGAVFGSATTVAETVAVQPFVSDTV